MIKSGLIVRVSQNLDFDFCERMWKWVFVWESGCCWHRGEEQLNLILCLHPPHCGFKLTRNLPRLIFLDTVQSPPWPLMYTSHHPLLQFSEVGHGTHWCQPQQSSSRFHNFLAAMQIKAKLKITLQFKRGAKMLWTLADVDHFLPSFYYRHYIDGVQHKAQTEIK